MTHMRHLKQTRCRCDAAQEVRGYLKSFYSITSSAMESTSGVSSIPNGVGLRMLRSQARVWRSKARHEPSRISDQYC
jgi:hypothetical protein